MTGSNSDLGPELRRLAQAILDRLDPAVRLAAASAVASAAGSPGKCQQVWCPVCALAAVVNGEQHPMLTVIAEHSVALLDAIRAVLADGNTGASADGGAPGPDDEPDGPPSGGGPAPTGPGRYQHIPVTVED